MEGHRPRTRDWPDRRALGHAPQNRPAPPAVAIAPFAACGVELEYMIVDAERCDVKPIADELLCDAARGRPGDVDCGPIGWSNELVAHVIEVKNPRPVSDLRRVDAAFSDAVAAMNAIAANRGARLMPSAMHPWMDPGRETRLWPRDPNRVYATYDRIFDCRRHGWANLQSMHVNLPFDDDTSFVRLHDAIRLVIPILPALAASSPFAEGRATGWLDWRLETYRSNAAAFPSITGLVVPEVVDSRIEYRSRILAPMYRDVAAADPEGVLAHEWLNSRGAIPRFARSAIEIRVIDMQECPRADLAIAAATTAAVRALYDATWGDPRGQRLGGTRLQALLMACARDGERTVIEDSDYLACFGFAGRRCEARELWMHVVRSLALPGPRSVPAAAAAGALATAQAGPGSGRRGPDESLALSASPRARATNTASPTDAISPIGKGIAPEWLPPLEHILTEGPLARRMLEAVARATPRGSSAGDPRVRGGLAAGAAPPHGRLAGLAAALCDCLAQGRQFDGLD